MSNFYVRGVLANLITLAILLACLFIPAGTLDYWQAWVFVAVFGVSAQAIGIYFLVHDRTLLERRMNIGPAAEQRLAQKFLSALFMTRVGSRSRCGLAGSARCTASRLPPRRCGHS